MRRAIGTITAAVAALALALAAIAHAGPGAPATITVEPGGADAFDPDDVTRNLDRATFEWEWDSPPTRHSHNVREDSKLFTSGQITKNGHLTLQASAGSYHYYCDVHGSENGGMDGRIKVRPIAGAVAANNTFRLFWAENGVRSGDRFDVRYRVSGGPWKDWKQNTSQLSALFGSGGSPVAQPNRAYQFQARSQKGTKNKTASDWSPALTVHT